MVSILLKAFNKQITIMNNIKLQKFVTFFVSAFLLAHSSVISAADIRLKIDRNNIEINETFTLVFEATDNVDDDPDFSPLEKDFKILRKSTSSNISIINGQYQKNQRWNISLIALREGILTIPAIHFGSDVSKQHNVTINPVKKSSGKQGSELISELIISTNNTYPQSQIVVTQRLLSSRNINGYEFSALKLSGVEASFEPLGELKQYQSKRGETAYLVLEQHYVVYPQTTGTLTIEPSVASARLSLNNRSNYDPFSSNTKTIRRASEAKTITIKAIPKSFKGKHWLPAKEVQLVEEFPGNINFKVGDPITRTISLLADGQSASQLPEFQLPDISGLKQYPDKPLLNNNQADDGVTGIQQIKVALIPTRTGSYTLPEISVPWWNTTTNQMQIAKIAARTFTVSSADKTPSSTAPSQPVETSPVLETEALTESPVPAMTDSIPADDGSNELFWKVITVILAIGWILTLVYFWFIRRNTPLNNTDATPVSATLKQSSSQISKACDNSDAQACKNALLNWGNALFTDQPVHSLGELAQRVDEPLAARINTLSACLYKNSTEAWQCEDLLTLCNSFEKSYIQKNTIDSNSKKLEDLYR